MNILLKIYKIINKDSNYYYIQLKFSKESELNSKKGNLDIFGNWFPER